MPIASIRLWSRSNKQRAITSEMTLIFILCLVRLKIIGRSHRLSSHLSRNMGKMTPRFTATMTFDRDMNLYQQRLILPGQEGMRSKHWVKCAAELRIKTNSSKKSWKQCQIVKTVSQRSQRDQLLYRRAKNQIHLDTSHIQGHLRTQVRDIR